MSNLTSAHRASHTLDQLGHTARLSTPPINMLPPDILVEVFAQVCNTRPCPAGIEHHLRATSDRTFLKDPVTLTHVCSYWRRIAVNLAPLWAHIDLFPDQFRDPLLAARLYAYSTRSSQALLDIHIMQKTHFLQAPFGSLPADHDIIHFLATAAPRMKRLTLTAACGPSRGKFCDLVLATCFANFTPGTLKEVSIDAVTIQKATPEAFWSPVTVLRLQNYHPGWSSKAYHGLTELRLNGTNPISYSRLASILELSPKLRILELDVSLRESYSSEVPSAPVRLEELEILVLKISETRLGPLLRLIAPGQKPLSLSILDPYLGPSIPARLEIEHFIARSNVTQLCVHEFDGYSQLAEVLSLMPTVRTLAISDFRCSNIEDGPDSPNFTLDALYVLDSGEDTALFWYNIEQFVKRHKVQKLTLWKCRFEQCGLNKFEGTLHNEHYGMCPTIEVVSEKEPNPVQAWC
ncbi:unnamed protein product [Rhizoctonia solani]|uniref:F-box domain-containing protein n=1 Tax=Rhizoctonia solani TaxID=456999 RepID=A0A8H2ZY33_9AGAM|nr:unnamed protein product [Rhizoctonia solani]